MNVEKNNQVDLLSRPIPFETPSVAGWKDFATITDEELRDVE